ncbi:MAG: hypothetical protein VB858_06320, partial [Planctomycetaceae bacterium]
MVLRCLISAAAACAQLPLILFTAMLLLPTVLATPVHAAPVLEAIFPLSCRSGGHRTVTVSGQDLTGVQQLVFSLPEVTAKHIEADRFEISVAADSRPQDCDVWCVVAGNISNPRRFVISGPSVAAETGDNNSREQAQILPLPGAVDGRFEKTAEVDWFGFEVQQEVSLTLRCRSRSLDGVSIPVLTLFDSAGREIAHSSDQQREPLLHCRLREPGTCHVRISERAYRKAAGSCYRLELLTGPQIAATWPDLIQRTRNPDLTFYGFGLHTPSASGARRAGNHTLLGSLSGAS